MLPPPSLSSLLSPCTSTIPFSVTPEQSIGLVLSSSVPLLCMYTEDRGSGGMVNGGCGEWHEGSSLEWTMKRQRHGKFNEAIVGGLYYEQVRVSLSVVRA